MELKPETTLEEMVRAGSLLSEELGFKTRASVLVEQSLDITKSDLACLYLHEDPQNPRSDLRLAYRRGGYPVAEALEGGCELIEFLEECGETVVLLERKESPFLGLLLHPQMASGIALPLRTPKARLGMLVLNSRKPLFYDRQRFHFLDSFAELAGGMLHNSRLFQELKETLGRVEEMERYQENIFTSMTNLLVTTDGEGKLRYFNQAAAQRMELGEEHLGRDLQELFKKRLGAKILRAVGGVQRESRELLGAQGIYRGGAAEMDFSLNVSPLTGKRGRVEGLTLLFTDQTRERELQSRMEQVVEERRLIKDMFSRYLSAEVVRQLIESPDLVKLGGDKKEATIFFADIRGYTSFSEGKDPSYIVEVLNEYFSEAVEIVVKRKGYIDKFIGDCIMAAWGVPLQSVEEDAVLAVTCALEIQALVGSKERKFFRGEASRLKIGIGMHTGSLVAGNLGSSRRMNYTVIGDTVNVAARLEGVAGPGEVIITQRTREAIGDRFLLQPREPVTVKGKSEAIPIYRVLRKAS